MTGLDAVIPAYAPDPALLRRAAASARAAADRLGGGAVIVVDDGSPVPVGDPGPGVRLIRQRNAGPSGARNAGLDATAAPWVLLLDADDEALPAGVAAAAALGERLGAALALGARELAGPGAVEGRPAPVPPEWAGRALPSPGDVFRPIRLFSSTGVLVSRRALAAGVRFDPALRIGEDRDFFRRCADVGPVAIAAEPTVRYTLHGGAAGNLTSAAHLERRIADHLVLLDRHLDAASEGHFREATRWLINAASKARPPVPRAAWDALVGAASARGWRPPLKCRLRRRLAGWAAGPAAGERGDAAT